MSRGAGPTGFKGMGTQYHEDGKLIRVLFGTEHTGLKGG